MKLNWLDADNRKTGNCYAGINFREVRMLTFSITQRTGTYFDRTGKAGWALAVGKEDVGIYTTKLQAQAAAQRFLDDFIRGLFAADD